jgi:hypothetical protein
MQAIMAASSHARFAERLVGGDGDAGCLFPFGQDLEQQLGAAAVEFHIAELIHLCGHPHRWIYADTATMPRGMPLGLVTEDGSLVGARHSYRPSRKASVLSLGW